MKVADGIFTAVRTHVLLGNESTSKLHRSLQASALPLRLGFRLVTKVGVSFHLPASTHFGVVAHAVRRSRQAATAAILAIALSGCNGTLPPVPTEVWKPVPVPCIAQADIPTATFATDAELAALPDGPFVLALARDRLERQGHISALEAVLQACAEKSPVSGANTTPGER